MFWQERFLGIALADQVVAGVYVEKKKRNNGIIQETFVQNLPPGIVSNGNILKHQELIKILKPLIKEKKLIGKKTILVSSTSDVINRLANMPLISGNKLKEAVYWEIRPFLPLGREEMCLDYLILQRLGDERGVNQVYITGLAKELMLSYMLLIKKIGLVPWRIESRWAVLFRLWRMLNSKIGGNLKDSLFCLYLGEGKKGQFVVSDLKYGYTVRQIASSEQGAAVFEEISYIDNYLQKRYQNELVQVFSVGELNSYHEEALLKLGKKVVKLNLTKVVELAGFEALNINQLDSEKFVSSLLLSFVLCLGEVLNDEN